MSTISEDYPVYICQKKIVVLGMFSTCSGVLDPEELFQTLKLSDMGNSLDTIGNGEQKVVPSESLEAEKTSRTGECNLRKSLAWDSAFFTSAGGLYFQMRNDYINFLSILPCSIYFWFIVYLCSRMLFYGCLGVLEPEELSMMNKGFKKPHDSCPTPRIEEMWRSVESNSTVESDSSPLTSLEIDLFEDIRASAKISTQVSNVAISSSNLQGGRRVKNVHCK